MVQREATLSAAEARRVALAAQGFTTAPKMRARRAFDAALDKLHVLQIDSVNVFARSHYMPMFSRHGVYEQQALDTHMWESGEFTEYWAHEAAFVPVTDRKLFGWRMNDFRDRHDRGGHTEKYAGALATVQDQLRAHGPMFARELESAPRENRGTWWDWSDTKQAVEMLFARGDVVSTGRVGFQRRYALTETFLAPEHLVTVDRESAQRQLIAQAARSLGVATLADLADYHRLKTSEARTAVLALEEAGELVPVRAEGWTTPSGAPAPAWLHTDTKVPSRLAPNALLTPFDPIVWFRPRAERLFNFHYRIEIYTPKERRQYGYYCLPLMVSGKLVGRIDLKADRAARVLRVQAAWQEEGAPAHTAEAARALIARAAAWQGLEAVTVSGLGNLPLPGSFDAEV